MSKHDRFARPRYGEHRESFKVGESKGRFMSSPTSGEMYAMKNQGRKRRAINNTVSTTISAAAAKRKPFLS